MTLSKLPTSILLSLPILFTACQPSQNVVEKPSSETLLITEENNNIIELQKLAEQGDAEAQFELGLMYYDGRGVRHDYHKAVEWFTKSANQGYAKAQNNLGVMYDTAKGVRQDYTEAIQWYQKAANQGNVSAQYNLGVMYSHGYGVRQDKSKAKILYGMACDKGFQKGCNIYRILNEQGF